MARETMKIAVCAPLDLKAAGGVEVHILELTQAMRRLGAEVEIFTENENDDFRSLRRLKDHHFDIIHTHGSFFSRRFLDLAWRRENYQRHVHTLHGVSIDYLWNCRAWLNWRCYVGTMIEGLCSRYADHVIAVSQSVKRRAQQCFGVWSDKITVIGNGFNPDYFAGRERKKVRRELKFSADDIVVLFVGRGSDKVKGAAAVAAAMGELRQCFPNLYLLAIPGDGFAEAAWLRKTGLVDYKDIHRFYGAADIFVNASLNEGMPLTVIEAMAAGLAIVAAAVGGIPELITSKIPYNNNISMGTAHPTQDIERTSKKHPQTGNACDNKGLRAAPITERTGLLLQPDRGDLTQKLQRLLEDKSLRLKLGHNARYAVRKLTWEHIAQQTINVYESVISV